MLKYTVTVGALRGGGGVTQAHDCTVDGILKPDKPVNYTAVNEYIAGRLALAAALPVPPGVLTKLDDGTPAYVSLLVTPSAGPVNFPQFVAAHPGVAAAIAMFDCWIRNEDRNAGSVRMEPCFFDHGHAVFGAYGKALQELLRGDPASPWFKGPLVAEVTDGSALEEWCQRLAMVPDHVVDAVCRAPMAHEMLEAVQVRAVSKYLKQRKHALSKMLAASHASFPKVAW